MAYLTREQHKIPDYIVPVFDTLSYAGFTNQPANDDVQAVSNNTGDTGKLTIFGIDNGNTLTYQTITLNGTTPVDSVLSPKWKTIYGAFMGDIYGKNIAAAVGTITMKEKSGGLTITTIGAGKISTGMVGFDMRGKNVSVIQVSGNLYFNQTVAVTTANGYPFASTEKFLVKPSDLFYLISDGSGATSKILVYKD